MGGAGGLGWFPSLISRKSDFSWFQLDFNWFLHEVYEISFVADPSQPCKVLRGVIFYKLNAGLNVGGEVFTSLPLSNTSVAVPLHCCSLSMLAAQLPWPVNSSWGDTNSVLQQIARLDTNSIALSVASLIHRHRPTVTYTTTWKNQREKGGSGKWAYQVVQHWTISCYHPNLLSLFFLPILTTLLYSLILFTHILMWSHWI